MIRATTLTLGIAALLPWYESRALVAYDRYLGNPLPLVDWVVVGATLLTLVWQRWAGATAAIGMVDVCLGWLLLYGDRAEGIEVSLLPGLPVTTAASVALFLLHRRTRASGVDRTG